MVVKGTDIVILGFKDLLALYPQIKKDHMRFILSRKGCPVLPRRRGAPYKVIKDEFEIWMRNQTN